MQQLLPLWRTEAGTALVTEVGDLRLVVRNVGGHPRFLVLRPLKDAGACPHALIASGTEADVRAAMAAAERMLERFGQASSASPDVSGASA
jgi:hypothetical protein